MRGQRYMGRIVACATALAIAAIGAPSILADSGPGVPGNLTAGIGADLSVTLTWSAPRSGASAYEVESAEGRTTTQQRSLTLRDLHCGHRYAVSVRALDSRGRRSDESTVAVSGPCDTQAPSQPQGLKVAAQSPSSLTLSWSPATDNVGVERYEVRRNGDDDVLRSTVTSATFDHLRCGTAYSFTLTARDAAGNRSTPAQLAASTDACPKPPAPVRNLLASAVGQSSITLSWLPSTGAAGYAVRLAPDRRDDDEGRWTPVAGPPFTVAGLDCGRPYLVQVIALDAAGRKSEPERLLVRTASCAAPAAGLSAPTGLGVTTLSQTAATVGWQPVTGATSYAVAVDTGAAVAVTGTAYQATGLTCATAHTFSITARDAAGVSSPAATLGVTTAACGAGNLWVDDDGGTCTRAAIAAAYSDAGACGTFQAALTAAGAGDTVLARCRTTSACAFAPEHLSGSRAGAADVVIASAPGSAVSLSAPAGSGSYTELQDLHHVTFQNIGFGHDDLGVGAPSLQITCTRDVTLSNSSGRRFDMFEGNANITFSGGDWGGYGDPGEEDSTMGTTGPNGPLETCPGDTSPQPQRAIVFDAVTWHDVFWNIPCDTTGSCSAWGESHPDCFEINGYVDGVTVRNSTFSHCGNTMLSLYTDQGPVDNVVVQHNVFRDMAPTSYWGIQWTDTGPFTCSGDKFLNNTYSPNAPTAWMVNTPPRFACNLAPGGVPTEVAGNTFQQAPPPSDCLVSKTGDPTDTPPKTYKTYWHDNVFLTGSPCVS